MNYVDETNPAALMDTAIKNMLEDLDLQPLLNEQDVEAYQISNAGEYSGIGAHCGVHYKDNWSFRREPYKTTPPIKQA